MSDITNEGLEPTQTNEDLINQVDNPAPQGNFDPPSPPVDTSLTNPGGELNQPVQTPDVAPAAVEQETVTEQVAAAETVKVELKTINGTTGEPRISVVEVPAQQVEVAKPEDFVAEGADFVWPSGATLFDKGLPFIVRATRLSDDKVVIVGFTQNSDGAGLPAYIDAHPNFKAPFVSAASPEDKAALGV